MTNPVEPPPPAPSPPGPDTAPGVTAAPPRGSQGWLVLSLALVGMLAGGSIVMLVKSPGQSVKAASAPASSVATTVTRSNATDAATRPKWSGGVRRSNGRNVAVYELPADNDVALWNKVVRPVLTVRCVAGSTEVFVLTQSAAAIDGDDGKHAVRVAYDSQPVTSQRWIASEDYDALFTEDGVGAARRIAAARTMSFGFTPYNAAPVVAEFQVAGFDALASKLSQACRWAR